MGEKKVILKKFNELTLSELYEILKARAKIFVLEQNINYVDMDNIDYNSFHFFIKDGNEVIAYLRAFYIDDDTIQIGRVLTIEHGNGIGKKLFKDSLSIIKDKIKCKRIYMHAQKQVEEFYKKFGFSTISDEFLEEGIIHVKMELNL